MSLSRKDVENCEEWKNRKAEEYILMRPATAVISFVWLTLQHCVSTGNKSV